MLFKKIIKIFFFVPVFVPKAETQTMFDESFRILYTISFDSCYTDRNVVDDGLYFQKDIESTKNIESP